jgi:hypothetical protein
MGVSNNITACLNFAAILRTFLIVATGLWFAFKQGAECARLARWPMAILGGLLLLVALAGFLSFGRSDALSIVFLLSKEILRIYFLVYSVL